MIIKYIAILLFIFIGLTSYSQSQSKVILNKADDLFSKNYNASFDLCCQAEKINDIKYIAEVSLCKARYYITFTDYENAEIELSKAISFYKSHPNLQGLSHAYDLKSILLGRIGDSIAGIKYLLKAYQISKKSGDKASQIKRLINLSYNFIEIGELSKADFYLAELESFLPTIKMGDLFYYHQNKGFYHFALNDYQKAIEYFNKAYSIATKSNMIDSKASILTALSKAYRYQNKLKEAEKYAQSSYEVAKKFKLIFEENEALTELILIKESLKDFATAYKLQKEFLVIEKQIINTEKLNRVSAIQNRLVLAEKENIITKQNSKIAEVKLKNTESELQNQKLYIFILIVLVVFIFVVFIFFKTKKLNATIQIQKQEVVEKNKLVESQNKDITDSIKYAERIQHAILPPIDHWSTILPNSFVYFAPKDILSGDFYWIEQTEEHIFIAAADCTGHGVPGALISIVNYNLLNKAVLEKHIYDPAAILDAVNNWLTDSLHQTISNSTVKDGMDISLITINKKTNELHFSGAYNPLFITRNDELIEIKGDKFPVGAFINEERQFFTTKSFQLEKNDSVYLFTDGYADQFGGPKDKKFKITQLKEIFKTIQNLSSTNQKEKLDQVFTDWKGKNEQVDDVLIIGIKIE